MTDLEHVPNPRNGPYSIIRFQITHTRAVNGGGGGGGELAGGHE